MVKSKNCWFVPLIYINGTFVFFLGLFFIFLVLSPRVINAQVVINEFSSATTSDWIELYNLSDTETVDLNGWAIKDTTTTPVKKWNSSLIIPIKGFCGITELGSRLDNKGDRLELYKGDERKNCVAYGDGNGHLCGEVADVDAPPGGLVASRFPDGTGTWRISSATLEYSNGETQEPASKLVCYAPTPTPTPTPEPTEKPTQKPTSAPTPTKTPSPSSTKTPTPRSTIKANPSPSPTTSENTQVEVLGLRNELQESQTPKSQTPTPTPAPEKTKKKIPISAILLIFGGVVFLGLGGLMLVKGKKVVYNHSDDKQKPEGKETV